jgi:phospholipid-transporting ATPase
VKYELGKEIKDMKGAREGELFELRKEFNYERPNPFIYSFTGTHGDIALDNNNIVLRGCTLKITQWVTGLVIYTGVDTKIMLNSNKARSKKSRLEFKMGLIVINIFIGQMLITFLSAIISVQYRLDNLPEGEFVPFYKLLLMQWGSWILLFTNFVPISLIVTLEMVKYLQGINISNCHFLTSDPAEVRVQTSTLNEELGQIEHVFSDKTGTLTKNYMNFKYMTVGT